MSASYERRRQTREEETGVPDDLRWALEVLRAAAPPRAEDPGHYANRAAVLAKVPLVRAMPPVVPPGREWSGPT